MVIDVRTAHMCYVFCALILFNLKITFLIIIYDIDNAIRPIYSNIIKLIAH